MDKKELAETMLKIRAKKGLSQINMAEKELGISLNTLVKIEQGKEISKLVYFKILNYLEKEGYYGTTSN